jgi:hypothetical protein
MTPEGIDFDCSCGGERRVNAVSRTGLPHINARDRGTPIVSARCTSCGATSYLGWIPPTWISAIARKIEKIERERLASTAA